MRFGTATHLLLNAQHLQDRQAVARFRATRLPVWTSPAATYIICTNPRSGSWLLSDGLASTGAAGNPREWFNISEEQRYRARWRMAHASDLTYAGYLRLARAASRTVNGISGIKLHYYQMAELRKRLEAMRAIRGLNDAQWMSRLFPQAKYLWLRRRDKSRQAISLTIAARTNEWWTMDGAGSERNEAAAEPEFDAQAIARTEAALRRGEAKWRSYFEAAGIEAFCVDYEDLAAAYPDVIRSVLQWLGLPDAIAAPPPRLKRQSNARSEEWLARYLAFKGANAALAQDPAAAAAPMFPRARRPLSQLPEAWRHWIAEARLRHAEDGEIVRVLVRNGYSLDAAIVAVKGIAPT
jgi:LPS sulfotransferase NodH